MKERTDALGNAGRDGIGGDGTVAGSDEECVRVRVQGRRSPGCSENGSRLDLPLLQHAFPVSIFVPVRCVTAHCSHLHHFFSLSLLSCSLSLTRLRSLPSPAFNLSCPFFWGDGHGMPCLNDDV